MSAKAVGWVWEHSPYRSTSLLVHLAIADASGDDGTFDKNLRGQIATLARCSELVVAVVFQEMLEDGQIEAIDDDTYRLNMPER